MEPKRTFMDELRAALAARAGLLVWVLVIQAVILLPALLLAKGYYPTDDCLRHAAKAVDGRPWAEILVLRPGILDDPHAAWHGLLRLVHLATGLGAEGLVMVTVAFLFAFVLLGPLPWMKAPEAWLGAWVLAWIAGGGQMRLLLGRPFLVAMACLVTLMALWTRGSLGPRVRWLLTVALFCAGALLHGSWYLLVMIPAAFLLARRYREAGSLFLGWAGGCVLAAALTGHPLQFLGGQLVHLVHAVGPLASDGLVVTELSPSMGGGLLGILLLAALFLGLGDEREDLLRDPVFILALLGWLLGLKVVRFWSDWGYPCAVLWLAFRLEPRLHAVAPIRRLVLAAGICVAAVLLVTGADERRWAERTHDNSIVADRPELQGWLPGDGATLYAANMGIFYDTYYRNPHARWRYILGFEPSMMPPDDLATYQTIVRNYDNPEAWRPWLLKMGPEDRLAYFSATHPGALFPGLQWRPVGRNVWLGRRR